MLGKLIKYDLKDLFNISWIFYIVILVLSLLGFHFNNMVDHTFGWDLFGGIIHLALIAALGVFAVFTVFKIILRFNTSLFSDQAYLTHTLPVSKNNLFFSKVLSGLIYLFTNFFILVYGIVIGLCYVFTKYSVFFPKLNKVKGGGYLSVIESLIDEISHSFDIDCKIIILVFSILIILEVLFLIYSCYVGIILGNRKNNNKVFKSILYSFITYLAGIAFILVVFTIAKGIYPPLNELVNYRVVPGEVFDVYQKYGSLLKTVFLCGIGLYFIIDSTLLLIGNKLLKKKINLN